MAARGECSDQRHRGEVLWLRTLGCCSQALSPAAATLFVEQEREGAEAIHGESWSYLIILKSIVGHQIEQEMDQMDVPRCDRGA